MKLFIVLSVIFVSVLADELVYNRNSNDDLPIRSRITPLPYRDEQVNRHERLMPNSRSNSMNTRMYDDSEESMPSTRWNSPNGRAAQDLNGITAEQLRELFQQEQQIRRSNSNVGDSSLGYWATYPDAAAFDAKIKARLSSSRILSDKPQVRRKITEMAEEKFNMCKAMAEDRERACLGRITGQIMQLVAAVENMNRNPQ